MSGRRPIPIPVEPGRPRGALFLPGFYAWRILGPSGPFYFLPCLTHSCTPKTSTISPQCARRHSVNPARIPDARRIGAAAPGLTRPACYRPPWRLLWPGRRWARPGRAWHALGVINRPIGPGLPGLGTGSRQNHAKSASRPRNAYVLGRDRDAWDSR